MFSQTKTTLISICFIVITACSFKTVYNRLDSVIPAYIEGMVSLDDVLEKKVEQRSKLLIDWHRHSQLTQYANWLQRLQHNINNELTEPICEQHLAVLESFWHSILVKINEEMSLLIPLLSSQQREELFASIEEKNDDYRKEYLEISDEDRLDRNIERMVNQYENWFGDLTDSQINAIKAAASELQSTAELRFQQRILWQSGIKNIIDATDTTEKKSNQLKIFLDNYETNNSTQLKTITQFNRKVIVQLTVQLTQNISPEQKEYFMNETNDYIRIFTELAQNQ